MRSLLANPDGTAMPGGGAHARGFTVDHFMKQVFEEGRRFAKPKGSAMSAASEPIACTIVSVAERLRGWVALIHRLRDVRRQPPPIPAWDNCSTS